MKLKIFILEDEILINRSLEKVARGLGHHCLTTKSGEEALEKWPDFNPDLAFIDVLLPGMSGLEFLKKLGNKGKIQAKIVLISAHEDLKSQDIESVGASRLVKKPFDDIFQLMEESISLLN